MVRTILGQHPTVGSTELIMWLFLGTGKDAFCVSSVTTLWIFRWFGATTIPWL